MQQAAVIVSNHLYKRINKTTNIGINSLKDNSKYFNEYQGGIQHKFRISYYPTVYSGRPYCLPCNRYLKTKYYSCSI